MSDATKHKAPKVRFRGFTDDWEQRKLGDITTKIGSGKTPKGGNAVYQDTGVLFLRSQNVFENRVNLTDVAHISPEIDREMSNSRVKKDDVLLNITGASIGRSAVYRAEYPANVNQHVCVIRAKDSLMATMIQIQLSSPRGQNQIRINQAGGGREGLNFEQISKFKFSFPKTKDEVNLIEKTINAIDSTIALHQRKQKLLKKLKQAYLQKMFPKTGESVPEIRFEGFADDWEERKLGDVVGEIQSGNRLPKDSLTNGDVPYVVAQTKNDGVFTKIARGTLDYNGKPMKLFPGNSISFSIDNPEAMFYRNAEFYTSNIMRVIHEDHLTHEQYVFILENMKRFIRGYDWSRKFSGPVVSNLEYLQPSEEEQQKIGSFFKQLDDTIALHQRQLENLNEMKRWALKNLFV